MKYPALALLLSLLMIAAMLSAAHANPFTGKKEPPDKERASSSAAAAPTTYPFLSHIIRWQQQLNQKMAALTRQVRETGNPKPLIWLLAIAFGYGVIHAAGPGHGKAVTSAYILSRKGSVWRGMLFGDLVAVSHGISGIVLVLGLHYLLKRRVMTSLDDVTQITQLVSYGLITLIGGGLLVKNLLEWFKQETAESRTAAVSRQDNGWTMATGVAVGMIPCPGVVLVMLFCLSMNLPLLGVLLAACMTLGMAATISLIAVMVMAGRKRAVTAISKKRQHLAVIVERLLETLSAVLVTLFGLVFFIGSL